MALQTYREMIDKVFDDYWQRPIEEIRDAIGQSNDEFRTAQLSPYYFDTYWIAYADYLLSDCQIDRIKKILKGTAQDSDLEEYKTNIQHSLDLLDMLTVYDGKHNQKEYDILLRKRLNDMIEFAKQFEPFNKFCEAWIEANINKDFHGSVA